jgi:hypothetical protein
LSTAAIGIEPNLNMDEISLERGEEFSTTRNPEQKRSKIPITSLNYRKDSSTEMEHVFNKFGTQSKTFLQQGPGADMEQLIKKFGTQSKYKFSNNDPSTQKVWNKDPSTDMEQEFKKFGTFNKFPKQGPQYRYSCNTVISYDSLPVLLVCSRRCSNPGWPAFHPVFTVYNVRCPGL